MCCYFSICVYCLYDIHLVFNRYMFGISVFSVQGQVRDVMQKAFWDALELKLAADPIDFSHAVVLIEEIREVSISVTMHAVKIPIWSLLRRTIR